MAQTTLRQLADGKVIQNTVALFETSSCTGYSATADLHSLSLNLIVNIIPFKSTPHIDD